MRQHRLLETVLASGDHLDAQTNQTCSGNIDKQRILVSEQPRRSPETLFALPHIAMQFHLYLSPET